MTQEKIDGAHYVLDMAFNNLKTGLFGDKLYVAYSGGKDSECTAELAIRHLGVDAVEINYHATGIDPPEVVRHIRARFRVWEELGVECHFHKPKANMHDLIVAKGLPTRIMRYCCQVLKEGGGEGRLVVTGVRWAESARRTASHGEITIMSNDKAKRAKYSVTENIKQLDMFDGDYTNDYTNDIRHEILGHCKAKSKITFNPIVNWSDRDVWDYIRGNSISYCELYDEGFHRLGCIGCPMAGRGRKREFLRWPHMERYYKRAIAAMLEAHPEWVQRYEWYTVDDAWRWWMVDKEVLGQMEMEEQSND